MKHTKWIALAGILSISMIFAQGGTTSYKGKQVPAFKLTTFDGKTISNTSLKGKPYILDFWATWCGPCKAASPLMQKLHAKYAAKGLVVIGANNQESDGGKLAMKYPKEHKYTYTFTKNSDALLSKFKPEGIPFFVFVDKSGKVVETALGYMGPKTDAEFEALVKKIL